MQDVDSLSSEAVLLAILSPHVKHAGIVCRDKVSKKTPVQSLLTFFWELWTFSSSV